MEYIYSEHTADVKFTASASSLEDAFRASAKALIGVMSDPEKIRTSERREISLKAPRIESLIYDFLEELLFYLDSEGLFLPHVEKIEIREEEGFTLKAVLVGDKAIDYERSGDVKAITYNQMKIEKTLKGYEITAVIDI